MEEHKQILEMVAEGKITVEEATLLLDALREAPSEMPEHIEIHHVPDESTWSPVYQAVAERSARNILRTRTIKMKRGARSVDRILSFASHGVSPDYIREMQAVLEDVSGDELVALSSNDVSPEYVEELKDALGGEVKVGEIISLSSMDVTPGYVEEVRDALGAEVGVGEIISLSSMAVTPEYIEEIKDALGGDVKVGEIISLSSMGITARHIEDLHEAGIETPTVKDVLKAELDE